MAKLTDGPMDPNDLGDCLLYGAHKREGAAPTQPAPVADALKDLLLDENPPPLLHQPMQMQSFTYVLGDAERKHNERIREAYRRGRESANKLGVHLSHCNFGENMGICKYGDDDCPALSEEWDWLGKAISRGESCAQRERERLEKALADIDGNQGSTTLGRALYAYDDALRIGLGRLDAIASAINTFLIDRRASLLPQPVSDGPVEKVRAVLRKFAYTAADDFALAAEIVAALGKGESQ